MNNLVLFTASFPYGNKETYLEKEIEYLCQSFKVVTILPLYYNNKQKSIRKIPDNAVVFIPPIPTTKIERIYLFLRGLSRNCPYLLNFLKEFFRFGVYKSPVKMSTWFYALIDYIIVSDSHQLHEAQLISNAVFYFYWGTGWSYSLTYLKKLVNNSYVVRFHGGDADLDRSSGYIPLRHQVFNSSDLIICGSEKLKNYIMKTYDVNVQKLITFRLGSQFTGLNHYDYDSSIIRIVSVANCIELKRINLIIDILQHLVDKEVEWFHFGDGPLFNILLTKAKKLPSNIKTNFKGQVNNKDIYNFYKNTSVDIFINTSRHEGLPVSIMEAMSFGIPIIATDAGATGEIVSDTNGLLLPIELDPKRVADKIKNCKNNLWISKRQGSIDMWREKCSAETNYSSLTKLLINL